MNASGPRSDDAAPRTGRTVRIGLLAGLVLLCGLFVALAAWQVERRSWKLALIERTDQRVHAPPVEAPNADEWSRLSAASDAYRHVRVTGTFLPGHDTLVQAVTDLGNGYWVITPLQRRDGGIVLVNRGFVGADHRATEAAADAAAGTLVTGLLRISEPGGGFMQRNDAATNHWYSRDVKAIAAARGLQDVAPYFIDADAEPSMHADDLAAATSLGVPIGGLTVVAFTNNHLLYAIIWSILALMSAAGAWRVLADPRRRTDRSDSHDRRSADDATDR